MPIVRGFVAAMATLAAFYFVFWLPFSLLPAGGLFEWIRMIGSLACAAAVGRYYWSHTGEMSAGLVTHILLGAIAMGAIGFVGGFFGPIIFAPEANQGPLLGIFITGPLGFVVGGVGGGIYWMVRGRGAK
jgi:hypothetical protein